MNATVPLDELYDNLDQQGIEVFHCSTKEVVAVAEPSGYLCIDPKKVESTEHEREILIHEEGHEHLLSVGQSVHGARTSGKHRGSLRL